MLYMFFFYLKNLTLYMFFFILSPNLNSRATLNLDRDDIVNSIFSYTLPTRFEHKYVDTRLKNLVLIDWKYLREWYGYCIAFLLKPENTFLSLKLKLFARGLWELSFLSWQSVAIGLGLLKTPSRLARGLGAYILTPRTLLLWYTVGGIDMQI